MHELWRADATLVGMGITGGFDGIVGGVEAWERVCGIADSRAGKGAFPLCVAAPLTHIWYLAAAKEQKAETLIELLRRPRSGNNANSQDLSDN
ncbi:hypothetical protein CTI12_AA627400 [Artemisia annua]|uniref:Uncharacterized protein n=1 Tax=Artemisia annua TaxID=35608 RepID=A0A2U1K9X1_ARTAN|nr:hypothetical protein CTI12_AA627400 [Artemisia annua]